MVIVAYWWSPPAVADERTGRIPNQLTLAALATVLAATPFVTVEDETLLSVVGAITAGVLISGAPVLAVRIGALRELHGHRTHRDIVA